MKDRLPFRVNQSDIEDLELVKQHDVKKIMVFGLAPGAGYPSLISATEQYSSDWVVAAHSNGQPWPACDVSCYIISNITVAGWGNILLGNRLLTDPRIMPGYVKDYLKLSTNREDLLNRYAALQFREIDDPCVVIAGHGPGVYGHFLIEMLFRILVFSRIKNYFPYPIKFLLDASTPSWLLKILREYLAIDLDRIVFFDPNFERVHLAHAILPGRVLRDQFFHSSTALMIGNLKASLPVSTVQMHKKMFLVRGDFANPQTPYRILKNEDELANIAHREFGITPIRPELYSWHDQVRLFDHADFIVGQAGSLLHNTIFSNKNTTVASIGWMNSVQSEIGAVFKHRLAYFDRDIALSGAFSIDAVLFRNFIKAALVGSVDMNLNNAPDELSISSTVSAASDVSASTGQPYARFSPISLWNRLFSK